MSYNEQVITRLKAMLKAVEAGTFKSPNGPLERKARMTPMENEPTILCGNPEDISKQFIVLTEAHVSEKFDYYDEAYDHSRTLKPLLAMGIYEVITDTELKPLNIYGGHNSHLEMFSIHKEFKLSIV